MLFQKGFDLSKGRIDNSLIDKVKELLDLFMLRRDHSSPEVNFKLPEKHEVALFVPLTKLQRMCYLSVIKNEEISTKLLHTLLETESDISRGTANAHQVTEISSRALQKNKGWRALMNLLMILREVCVHPYLLQDVIPDDYVLDDLTWMTSGKFILLRKLLEQHILKEDSQVLIFSQWTKALDLAEDLLHLLGGNGSFFRYTRIDGSTDSARRNLQIRLFQDDSSDHRVMLLSTRAGGLGLNLTAANVVIFLDEDWNPQVTKQAEARAHRYGQTKPITVYKIYVAGSVEAQLISRADKKLYLSTRAQGRNTSLTFDPGEVIDLTEEAAMDDSAQPNFTVSQLQGFVRRGTQVLAYDDKKAQEMLHWDFERMLTEFQVDPEDTSADNDTSAGPTSSLDGQDWLASAEQAHCRIFEGREYAKQNRQETPIEANLNRADRRINKHTTVLVDGFQVARESLHCGEGEAVATLADKNPALKSRTRAKQDPIKHQSVISTHTLWLQG